MESYKTGKLIESLRKEKGLTQSELAKTVGVSKQAVSNWERGTRFPDVVLIENLALELGVSPTEIIKGEIMENSSVDKNDVSELVCRALKAQKKELGYRPAEVRKHTVLTGRFTQTEEHTVWYAPLFPFLMLC